MKNASVCGSAVYTHRIEVERHKFLKKSKPNATNKRN